VERSNKGEQAEQHWQQPRHAASGKAVESDQNGLQPERQARLSSPIPQGGETERHITRSPTKAAYTSSRARSPRWLRLSLAIPVDGGVAGNSRREFSILGFSCGFLCKRKPRNFLFIAFESARSSTDRAPDFESGGCTFEPCRAHQLLVSLIA
jgi:hypothetical protein